MFPRLEQDYYILVIEDLASKRVIGAGSLIIERKFIRDLGLCGHIEDIVVDATYRG